MTNPNTTGASELTRFTAQQFDAWANSIEASRGAPHPNMLRDDHIAMLRQAAADLRTTDEAREEGADDPRRMNWDPDGMAITETGAYVSYLDYYKLLATLRRQRANEGKVGEMALQEAQSKSYWQGRHDAEVLRSAAFETLGLVVDWGSQGTNPAPPPAANERTTAGEDCYTVMAGSSPLADTGDYESYVHIELNGKVVAYMEDPESDEAERIAHDLVAAINAAPSSAPAVSEGWQVVPKEPTELMMRELYRAFRDGGMYVLNAYKAALAAAPSPEGK